MFHANTQRVIDDWRFRRGERHVPLRADLSPAALGSLLPQLFMLGTEADGSDRFRLCGGLLRDLHGGDLRGHGLMSLWSPKDAAEVAAALAAARGAGEPVVVSAAARTAEGLECRLELLLAPLAGQTGALDRTLGLYQPTSSLSRLLGRPVERLVFRDAALAPPLQGVVFARPARSPLRLVAVGGRRVA